MKYNGCYWLYLRVKLRLIGVQGNDKCMCVCFTFEEQCLWAIVVGCLIGEQIRLKRLDVKV